VTDEFAHNTNSLSISEISVELSLSTFLQAVILWIHRNPAAAKDF